jgi:hypothetical protein
MRFLLASLVAITLLNLAPQAKAIPGAIPKEAIDGFSRVAGLGLESDVIWVAKKSQVTDEIRSYRLGDDYGRVARPDLDEQYKNLPSYIGIGKLSELLRGEPRHVFRSQGLAPHTAVVQGNRVFIGMRQEIRGYDLLTGEEVYRWEDKTKFFNIHSLTEWPGQPSVFLVANAGGGNLLRVNLDHRSVETVWNHWTQGYNVTDAGLRVFPSEPSAEDAKIMTRWVDAETAKQLASGKIAIPKGEIWGHHFRLEDVLSNRGLPSYLRTSFPNFSSFLCKAFFCSDF